MTKYLPPPIKYMSTKQLSIMSVKYGKDKKKKKTKNHTAGIAIETLARVLGDFCSICLVQRYLKESINLCNVPFNFALIGKGNIQEIKC